MKMVDSLTEKKPWEMTAGERIKSARSLKESGNLLFSEGKIQDAKERYSAGLKQVIPIFSISDESTNEVDSLKLPLYLNIAACQMKMNQYEYAIKNCTKALEIDNGNVKALYRRCIALTEINEFERAHRDAKEALSIDKSNQAVKKQLLKIDRDWKEKKIKYEKMMMNCFTEVQKDVTDGENGEKKPT